MKIKKLPNVLALHLKRFKYQEDVAKYIKLAYRVAFPYELRLFNTVDDVDDADRLYNLFAIVVHVGTYVCRVLFLVLCCSCFPSGPHHGHYISIIKTAGTWLVFDDDNVYPIPENDIPKYFGDSTSGSAYVLYYQAVDIDLVSLGLRPLEPPETITNLIPSPHRSPALQNQTFLPVPALPPGLNPNSSASSESDVDHTHLPPPTTPSPVPLHHSEAEEAVTSPMSVSITQSPAASSAVASSPMTSGFGTKLINTIRRAPSMSAARGSIGASPSHFPNGGGERRPITEKIPRPSTSTPSFNVSGGSSQEPPPPLPPLPPGIFNRSNSPLNVAPILNTQVTDSKKEKEKDKIKSPSGWFSKKKKSATEKSRPESGVPDPSLSPAIKGDERHGSHTYWFSNHASPMSPSPNGVSLPTDPTALRPDALKSERYERDHRPNGYPRVPPPEPPSSFHRSPSHLTDTSSATTQSRSPTLLSGSDTGSGARLDFPPSRKPSLVPSSADRFRSLIDRKKSIELKPASRFLTSTSTSRPMTAPSSPSYMATEFNRVPPPPLPPIINSHRPNVSLSNGQISPSYMTTDYNRMPPPFPPTHILNSHRPNMSLSNGQVLSTEHQNIAKGKAKSTDVDGSSAYGKPTYLRSTPVSESPTSLAASVGQNSSVGSTTSATSNIRRATRKLSLGFGKRDKDKDRERDRVSPSIFTRF